MDSVADGACCKQLQAAALPCHWLQPIQSKQRRRRPNRVGRGTLDEDGLRRRRGRALTVLSIKQRRRRPNRVGRGTLDEDGLRRRRGRALTVLSIPPGRTRVTVTGSRDSIELRVTAFGSGQSQVGALVAALLALGGHFPKPASRFRCTRTHTNTSIRSLIHTQAHIHSQTHQARHTQPHGARAHTATHYRSTAPHTDTSARAVPTDARAGARGHAPAYARTRARKQAHAPRAPRTGTHPFPRWWNGSAWCGKRKDRRSYPRLHAELKLPSGTAGLGRIF
jgi:hypothetical protein